MRLITVFVARGWLVLILTDSPFWVGAAPALRGITQIILGPFAGVMHDRVNRLYDNEYENNGSEDLYRIMQGVLSLIG